MKKSFWSRPVVAPVIGLIAALIVALGAACAPGDSDGEPATTAGGSSLSEPPVVLQQITGGRPAPATDTFEVWVCSVPADTTDPLYDPSGERVALTPQDVVRRIEGPVAAFFAGISHGAYRPDFIAGGVVAISSTDSSQQCIDGTLARSDDTADVDAVLVVADAQHAADQPGGRSTPGGWLTCSAHCSPAVTGRSVYVGANDFHSDLGDAMPFDLIEHELGHSLGLPHSGDVVGADGNRGVGPYDFMADPASPRLVDPSRRDAPDTLAINRLDLGWMPVAAVHIVDVETASGTGSGTPDRVELSPSTGSTGTRAAVIAIDDHRMLTVELLPATGFDDHLPHAGVVVHLVDDSPEQCGATTRCDDLERVEQIVAADAGGTSGDAGTTSAGTPDHTLLVAGDTVTFADWRVAVHTVDGDRASITMQRVVDGG